MVANCLWKQLFNSLGNIPDELHGDVYARYAEKSDRRKNARINISINTEVLSENWRVGRDQMYFQALRLLSCGGDCRGGSA